MSKIFRFQCISSRETSNKCFCVLKSMLSHYKNRWRMRIFAFPGAKMKKMRVPVRLPNGISVKYLKIIKIFRIIYM